MSQQSLKEVKSTISSTILCSEDGKHTYMVRKQFPERTGNRALVIQLYPTLTEADIDTTDTTMLHFLNHLDDLQLKEVTFVNLFSKVCKARPSTRDLAIDEDNLAQIKLLMQEKDFADCKVIVAWGASMEKNIIATEMKRRIIKMYKEAVPNGVLWQLTADDIYLKNDSAVHVLFMGIRHKNSKWKLEKFNVPQELLREEQDKKAKGKQKKDTTEMINQSSPKITDLQQVVQKQMVGLNKTQEVSKQV